VSDRVLPTRSVNALPFAVAVVVIVAFVKASGEPVTVKLADWPTKPLFVKDKASSVISPMSFVVVVCVVPLKTRLHDPEVVG
jgi:hypothetical protein